MTNGKISCWFLFKPIALHQPAQFFVDMAQLPNLRNVHTDAAEGLADVADNTGAVFDHEAHIKRHVDVVFRLQL